MDSQNQQQKTIMSILSENNYINTLSLMEINSVKEEKYRTYLLKNDLHYLNNMFNNSKHDYTRAERAYLMFHAMLAFELKMDLDGINWSKLYNNEKPSQQIMNAVYGLTNKQYRYFMSTLLDIKNIDITVLLNSYQLIIMNYMFSKYNFTFDNSEKYFNEHQNKFIYQGKRSTLTNNELYYDYLENEETKYTAMDMTKFFEMGLKKLFSCVRLFSQTQCYNVEQLTTMLQIIISHESILQKFHKYLDALDEKQIYEIGF